MVSNTQELQEEFAHRAAAGGLKIDCPASGLFGSEIAVIAEAPGPTEVTSGVPLSGGSGNLLWTTLRRHNIHRHECYVTNVSKRQVAFDTDDRRAPMSPNEFQLWSELLRWELAQLPNVQVLVLLGNYALKALTGNDGITAWRGSVVPITLSPYGGARPRTVTTVASFNPAAVLRVSKDQIIFEADMARIRRVREGRWKTHEVECIINPSFREAMDCIRSMGSSGAPVALDIETMAGETACVGLANSDRVGTCINFRTLREHRYSLEQERELRSEMQALLSDPTVRLIAQNGMFDASWLWFKDRIKCRSLWIDTMLAHHTLYPWMPHNLGFLCTQYTTHPYYKDEGKLWKQDKQTDESVDNFWRYNVKDCCITWKAAHSMLAELEQQGLKDFFFNHVMRLQSHLIRMTVGGVKLDETLRESINEKLSSELDTLKTDFYRAVHEATGDPEYFPNPLSTPQVSDLLFNRLKLVGRGSSTDDENRDRMLKDRSTKPAARKVLQSLGNYKEEHKFYSTYVETAADPDGRMRTQYKQSGVSKAPGRLSSAAVSWGHYEGKRFVQHGCNLQNQPTRAHAMYVADPDYTIVYADGSQAEARYVGWDAKIDRWIEDFEKARLDGKYDAHRALAAAMFKVPYDQVPSADEETLPDGTRRKTIRYTAKRCRHGLNYRMAADRLATTTGLPIHEAQAAWEIYHRTSPEVRRWWGRLESEARRDRMLFNSYGRRLFIQGRLDDEKTLESIVAFRPQSTVGDKVSRVIYLCEDDDQWPHDARMLKNIHDAVTALCRIDDAKRCLSIIKRHMEEPILVRGDLPPLIIPADLGVSEPDEQGIRRWSTIRKIKEL
jgi:uracil-DNA glycosylase family 4